MTLSVEAITHVPGMIQLREADAAECVLGGMTPLLAVSYSVSRSTAAYVAKHNGRPFAYWGWRPTSLAGHTAHTWLLTTPLADTIPTSFGRLTRRLFHQLHALYPTILVEVDPAHDVALEWLEWLGFEYTTPRAPFLRLRSDRKASPWVH